MPEHSVDIPYDDGRDGYLDGTFYCASSRIPGDAFVSTTGRLRCNRCGWVTPEPVVLTYDVKNDRHYLTWDEYVKEESNGWMVVAIITDGKRTWPWTAGPFPERAEARRLARSTRDRWKREREEPKITFTFHVRPAWKDLNL